MYKAITNYLCCPKCGANLSLRVDKENGEDVLEGVLSCESGHSFRISQGVADFNSEEQDFINQWKSMNEERSFEEIDREMDAKNPEEMVQRREMVLGTIADALSGHDCKVVLDIASGRGLMLAELVKTLDRDAHIISIDLSKFVLKYDCRKFREIAPDKKISYLACDATKLPLKDCVIDAAVTYGGFSNMLGCAGEALREAHRAIKSGGVLVDSYVIIEKESKGFETLHRVCTEQNMTDAEDFFLHDGIARHHGELFSAVQCNVAFEGIGVDNGMDLLPYQGEWYAEQVFVSSK